MMMMLRMLRMIMWRMIYDDKDDDDMIMIVIIIIKRMTMIMMRMRIESEMLALQYDKLHIHCMGPRPLYMSIV